MLVSVSFVIFNRYALIEARKRAGLSKAKLADLSGNSRPYITQVEAGDRSNPSPDVIEKWAEVCGVADSRALYIEPSMDELLREMNSMRGIEVAS
jgi:transcriptional regulator with XRE-family HTH domain